EEIPADLADKANEYRTQLIEACADYDDELMEASLGEEEIPHDRAAKSLHRACLDTKVTPVLCGSSFKNKGVQPLLDAIVELLPSPLEVPPVTGTVPAAKGESEPTVAERPADDNGPFAALAFKVMSDPYVGKLTYFRVYSGKLEAGGRVLKVSTRKTARIRGGVVMTREQRAERVAADDARQQPRGGRGVLLRRHLRRRRSQADQHRRHPRRPRRPDRPGGHRIPDPR